MENYLVTYGFNKVKLKKNWKCDSQELFERKLVDYFVQDYSRRRFLRKGFEPEVHGNLTRLSARNEIGRGFCLYQVCCLFQ